MIDKKTETLLVQIRNRMSDFNVDEKCINDVCNMISRTYDYTEHYGLALLKYAETKYYEYYGDTALDFRQNKKYDGRLIVSIANFRDANDLDLNKHKKFCDWLLENKKRLTGQQMSIFDVISYRFFKIYINENGEQKQVEKTKKFNKKMYIKPIKRENIF